MKRFVATILLCTYLIPTVTVIADTEANIIYSIDDPTTDVQIKDTTGNDRLDADDIRDIISDERQSVSVTNIKSIFDGRVTLTNQNLPRTDDTPQSNKQPESNQSDEDGLTYGEWLTVETENNDMFGGDESRHIWSAECHDLITDKSAKQYLYANGENSFTDEYGFRKYKANGHEYYAVALAPYFSTNGFATDKNTAKDPKSEEYKRTAASNGSAFQVQLADGSIVNCVIADAKSPGDDTMREDLRGHKSGSSVSVIECLVHEIHTPPGGTTYTKAEYHDNEINGSHAANSKNHTGSPWTSLPVKIRIGPTLPT